MNFLTILTCGAGVVLMLVGGVIEFKNIHDGVSLIAGAMIACIGLVMFFVPLAPSHDQPSQSTCSATTTVSAPLR